MALETTERRDVRRFLQPRSVAIVGASERQERSNNAIAAMREAGIVDLSFVNPRRDEVYGEATFPTVSAIGRPVDAVLSLVGAELAIAAVADARAAGAGGVVVIAGGFAEAGGEGVELERRLAEAAGDLPVLGPNCNGFIRPSAGVRLSGTPRLPLDDGCIGVVTHSGALVGALGLAAVERAVGYSSVISTGNEMAFDMADAIDFLVDDPQTRVIGLVVETIRSPRHFFAAARRAAAAGKPIVALKLGRSERGREIATSHTGALAGEAWVYEAAFRQHAIAGARDLVDLLDRLTLLAQLPAERWSALEGLAVLSLSGGWSAMAGDVCADEGVALPALAHLSDAVNAIVPGRTTVNPLDMTGFVMGRADVAEQLVTLLGSDPAVDAILVQWFVDASAGAPGAAMVQAAIAAASALDKPVVIGSIEDGHLGEWARDLPAAGVAVGRGLRSTIRGLQTMGDAVRSARRGLPPVPAPAPEAQRPQALGAIVASDAGPMLSFAAGMELLAGAGIPVAPHRIVRAGDDAVVPAFAGPYVVKLADVPHRTELGAVRLGVEPSDLPEAIAELRAVAAGHGVPDTVVVQPLMTLHGEAFVGIQNDGDLGPLVVCGVGGILVELLGRVAGRIAPFARADALGLLAELDDTGVFAGHRGGRGWDRDQLADVLVAAGRLAEGTGAWMTSLDINPLGLTVQGFVALDGLCLVRE